MSEKRGGRLSFVQTKGQPWLNSLLGKKGKARNTVDLMTWSSEAGSCEHKGARHLAAYDLLKSELRSLSLVLLVCSLASKITVPVGGWWQWVTLSSGRWEKQRWNACWLLWQLVGAAFSFHTSQPWLTLTYSEWSFFFFFFYKKILYLDMDSSQSAVSDAFFLVCKLFLCMPEAVCALYWWM